MTPPGSVGRYKPCRTLHLDFPACSNYTDFPTVSVVLNCSEGMRRERITDEVYVFSSERYAQVNAGLIATSRGAVLVGALVYPDETLEIKRFAEQRLGQPVHMVINTHYHADHTAGTGFFDGASVVAHQVCRELLDRRGRVSLEETRRSVPAMASLKLVLPDVTFTDKLVLYLGDKTLKLWHAPGHTPDSILVMLEEDQVLFGADTIMPLPFFVDGDYNQYIDTLHSLVGQTYENIVPGYGEVILRGEVKDKIQSDLDYLVELGKAVDRALKTSDPEASLERIDVEDCGKSRVLLNGMVQQLHRQNVRWLAQQRQQPNPESA